VRRSEGTIISVKVPIRWNMLTDKQRTRISRTTGRDTRVIKAYLGVIEHHEKDLLVGKNKKRIIAGKLDELTLTAIRGKSQRVCVLHDFKKRFPYISVNEFQECRDTAISMWHSYLECGGSKPLRGKGYTSRKLPRFAFRKCFDFLYLPEKKIKHWLDLRYSFDSIKEGRTYHDKLPIPLSPSSYHLEKLRAGEIKTVRLFKDRKRKWWAVFTVTMTINTKDETKKPLAVVGIDLGIEKTACTVLLTKSGYRYVRYWKQLDKLKMMTKYDEQIASLQKEKELLLVQEKDTKSVTKKLQSLSDKRMQLSKDYDRKLAKNLAEHIMDLGEKYDLRVSIGQLRGIRKKAQKGNYRGRKFRGKIHRWTFARFRTYLQYKLETLGFDLVRFFVVNESWTSIKCHKCGNKGYRPRQNLFVCGSCGYHENADLNGAINIGRRVIKLIPSLSDEKGLGVWLHPSDRAIPKTPRARKSKGKSSLPQRSPAFTGESVVEHYEQATLEKLESAKDQAMESTVETPSAFRDTGGSEEMQRSEARCQGRDHVPMKLTNAHVASKGLHLFETGDSCHGNGGTQEFLAVHSTCNETGLPRFSTN
jgi:IS605 OrfB family transposase